MRRSDDEDHITVLEAFVPNPTTNPYLLQLTAALEELIQVQTFSWSRLLTGRYDVLHLHWPEVLVRGQNAWKIVARCVAFVGALVVARCWRRGIVRTLHNVEPHEPLDSLRRAILSLADRWTTEWITLTPAASPPRPGSVTTIPLGHYRDWYRVDADRQPVDGRVLFFGIIRRYKGVEELVEAAKRVRRSPFELRFVGRCLEPQLAETIQAACSEDERITATLEFVEDRVLANEIQEAELVILPFRNMVNSSSVLLALTLERPVVVPRSETMIELEAEVGSDWVITYDSVLTEAVISEALDRAHRRAPGAPDLSARNWDRIAASHRDVFLHALRTARR